MVEEPERQLQTGEAQVVKELLFSVTLADCRVDTFRPSGHGGQGMQKRDSAVRITHSPSGAVGQSSESREQLKNKRIAMRRLAETKEFVAWAKLQAASELEVLDRIAQMEARFKPGELKVEYLVRGHWEEE